MGSFPAFAEGQGKSENKQGDEPTTQIDGPVYSVKDVDKKATILSKPEPGFTEEARRKNIQGVVLLSAILSSTGKVTNVEVLQGLPAGLTEKAIKAVRKVRFVPAEKDGKPVSIRVKFEYSFVISDQVYGDRSQMIYYIEGCTDYSGIKSSDLVLFKNETEAKKAGYRKAKKNCP